VRAPIGVIKNPLEPGSLQRYRLQESDRDQFRFLAGSAGQAGAAVRSFLPSLRYNVRVATGRARRRNHWHNPAAAGGVAMPGSIPAGGQITPFERDN
jgi:hypothetical protein